MFYPIFQNSHAAGKTDPVEKLTHARKLNIARRHLTQEQKRGLIREQLKETPEKSDRQIAKDLGVNHETVGSQRKNLEATGGIRQLEKTIGADGKERRKPVSVFNPSKREERAMLKNVECLQRDIRKRHVLNAICLYNIIT